MSIFFIALASLVVANLIFAAFLYFRPTIRATTRSRLSTWVLRSPVKSDANNRLLAALRD